MNKPSFSTEPLLMPKKKKLTWLKYIAALSITLALIFWLVAGEQWRGVFTQFLRISGADWLIIIPAFILSYLLRAGRIFDEFRDAKDEINNAKNSIPTKNISFSGILCLSLIHNATVNILPFRSGEASFPFLLSRWFNIPVARGISSLLWLRIQDAVIVLLLAACVWPNLPLWLRILALLSIISAAAGFLIFIRSVPKASHHSGRFPAAIYQLTLAFAETTRRGSWRGWLWTLANWLLKLFAQAWLLKTLLETALSLALLGVIGAELAAVLPIQGVAGFGTYEAGSAALLGLHGITLTESVQATLVLHLFVIAASLSAGALAASALMINFLIKRYKKES